MKSYTWSTLGKCPLLNKKAEGSWGKWGQNMAGSGDAFEATSATVVIGGVVGGV